MIYGWVSYTQILEHSEILISFLQKVCGLPEIMNLWERTELLVYGITIRTFDVYNVKFLYQTDQK